MPEARPALEQLKQQVLREKFSGQSVNASGSPMSAESTPGTGTAPVPQADRGGWTARQAGKLGGEIGGTMVKRLIAMAEQQLTLAQGVQAGPGRHAR